MAMRPFPKAPSTDIRANGTSLRQAAIERYFDQAAYHFFMKYNGEPPALGLHDFLERFERAVVFEALVRAHGSQAETALFLRVKKQTLNAKVKKQHILITKQIVKQPI
jgi:DNA-binding NtrC family response regulator